MDRKQVFVIFTLTFFVVVPFFFIMNMEPAHADTPVTLTTTQDAVVDQANGDTNFGTGTTLTITSTAAGLTRTLIGFDTHLYADENVLSAILKVNVTTLDPATIAVTALSGAWAEETVTWNSQPSTTGSNVTQALTGGGVVSIDITSIYASASLFSVQLKDNSEGSGVRQNVLSSREGSTDPTLQLTVESGEYILDFHGVYDETTGAYLGPCNATAYFSGASPITFEIDEDRARAFDAVPTYLSFDLGTAVREYWLMGDEANNTDIYVYNDDLTSYVINFIDYTSISDTYNFVTAKASVNGSFVVVEQRKIDVQNSVAMSLVEGRKYQIEISDSDGNSYVYGDLLMTATTGVQLTLRGVDFPKETLLSQKYVHIYATRTLSNPSGFIIVDCEDESAGTTSTTVTIKYQNGSTAYTYTSAAQSWVLNWTSADNNTRYLLTATITHSAYGELEYRQLFVEAGSTGDMPFSLNWLGSLGFDTAYIIPALFILLVAGCFSALNAEVGMVLSSITAIIFTVLGWIPIPMGALVAACFLSICGALIYNKRRVTVY